jgi:hypothetical protein
VSRDFDAGDVAIVLELNERLRDALHDGDVETVEELYADEFMPNGPRFPPASSAR